MEVTRIAWDRAGLVPQYDFMNRYSAQHLVRDGGDHALCGARIRWLYISPGDSTRCARCFGIAARHGYVDEYGEEIHD